jgi:hypothetical protein
MIVGNDTRSTSRHVGLPPTSKRLVVQYKDNANAKLKNHNRLVMLYVSASKHTYGNRSRAYII